MRATTDREFRFSQEASNLRPGEQATIESGTSEEDSTMEESIEVFDRSKYPFEKVTEAIGREGKTIEIGGCSVTFPRDCFQISQQVTITTEVNPNKWPSGRVGIAPSLDISAPTLRKKVKVKLTTWYLPDDEGENSMVDVLVKKNKEWVQIHSCSVYASRTIEFEAQHFCLIQAVLRKFGFNRRYSMQSVIYYSKKNFVVAVMLNDEKIMDKCRRDMIKHFKTPCFTCLKNNVFSCYESNVVESHVFCVDPEDGFKFDPPEHFPHSIADVFQCETVSRSCRVLLSRCKSQPITVRFHLEIDGQIKEKQSFSRNWEADEESGDKKQIVAGIVNYGKVEINKYDCSDIVNAGAVGSDPCTTCSSSDSNSRRFLNAESNSDSVSGNSKYTESDS